VQFFPMLAILPTLLLFPPRYTGPGWLLAALACYVLAKICEHPFDASIFQATRDTVSGHTLKHLLAALGAYCVLCMLWRRHGTELEHHAARS
jgi:hypothetical protein